MRRVMVIVCMVAVCMAMLAGDAAEAIRAQKSRYPLMRLQDVYKTFYQDYFGAEHMIGDTAAVQRYMEYELVQAAQDTVANPYYEPTGCDGRYIRVYLRCVTEGRVEASMLTDAFIRSARPNEVAEWETEWQKIVTAAQEAGILFDAEEAEQLAQISRLRRAVRHSEAYREAYHPHYRIVAREIFENEILPLIPR